MGTTAQAFYCTTVEQDFTAAGEVDIRALSSSPVAANSTTIAAHPNAAGTTQITLDPYTTRSTTGDIRANAGWAINRLSGGGTVDTLDLADSSSAGRTLTKTGTVSPVTSPTSGFGGAAQFTTGSSVLSLPVASASDFDPRAGRDRSYEVRLTITNNNGATKAIMGQWSGAAASVPADWLIALNGSNQIQFLTGSNIGAADTLTGPTLNVGQTYVIQAQRNAIYVDGVRVVTATFSVNPNASATDFRMNAAGNFGAGDFIVDEVRISNGLRNTANYTPATTPFTSDANTLALWHFDTISTPAPGGDGMESIVGARRIIPAGTWNIAFGVSIPAGGTVTGTLTLSLIIGIYRVSAAGARTLILSATGPTTLASGIGAASGIVGGNITVPQITLEANETIHVGILTQLVQVAGLLGATVAGTATFQVGDGASITVTTPGIRTLYDRALTDSLPTVADTLSRIATFPRSLNDTVTITDTLARRYTGSRSLSDAVPLSDTLTRVAIFPRALTDTMPVADSIARQFIANRTLTDNMPINDALTRRAVFNRALSDNMPITDVLTRRATYARPLLEEYRTGGGGTIINNYRSLFVFDD